ncbi:hypothetical protein [Actinokineospora sp. NBRC 105648]|uniref:hypothetical protein n=1 Tax=Actinokineospora sp. NBRC 105648 TaxID=3032206 RepID=UPI0024A5B2A0|nr:hypothetical protein [Actinokineospora sp. NBRC 105648]GLZ41496.1 hypothetical protein Acsp05_51200 [Actinokineospora sp. NBRC 105648]
MESTFEPGTSPVAARLAVSSAVLLGVAAVLVYAALPNTITRVVLLLFVLVLAGGVLGSDKVADAVGQPVARGIGVGGVLLGTYLTGPVLLSMAMPSRYGDKPPSAVVLVVLAFLALTVALLTFAAKGFGAGAIGLGFALPSLVVALLGNAKLAPLALAVTMLVAAVGGLVLGLRAEPGGALSRFGLAAGAIAAAAAAGIGFAPLNALSGGSLAGAVPDSTAAMAPQPGARIAFLVLGLLVAVLVGLVAVLRRDGAVGLLVLGSLVLPPVALYRFDPTPESQPSLLVVPGLVFVAALIAAAVAPVRELAGRLAGGLRPGGATTVNALLAVAGLAVAGLATQALPLLYWDIYPNGAVSLVVVVALVVLALRLSGAPGALAAGAALLVLALRVPMLLLVDGTDLAMVGPSALSTALALVLALVASWLLLRRHPYPGVAAAAAYLVLHQVAMLLWVLFRPATTSNFGDDHDDFSVIVLLVPVLLVGAAGAVVALRARAEHVVASAQAAAAMAAGAGGFALFGLQVAGLTKDSEVRGIGRSLMPMTPTNVFGVSSAANDLGNPLIFACFGVVALAVLVALTTARRPSGVVAAAVLLLGLGGGLALVVATLKVGSGTFYGIMWIAVMVAVVLGVVARIAVRRAPTFYEEYVSNAAR